MKATFRSLRTYNYRLWASGAIVSNVGTWMQRTAQDWLVLTELTHHDATAVGIVMALQFGPQAVLLPITGYAADRFDRRKVLMATQAAMGCLAAGLGLLTVLHWVQLWQVYVFALLLGIVSAFDIPARHTFVSDMVPAEDMPNAVALNSASFNAARLVGPATAGLTIAAIGTGWAFLANGLSFAAVLTSLFFLRRGDIRVRERQTANQTKFADGLRLIAKRPDLRAIAAMYFLIGTFGLNYPIFISTMAVTVFHKGAGQFGILTSTLALGSVTGALLSAGRPALKFGYLLIGAAAFGLGSLLAAGMPGYWLFGLALASVGLAAQTFSTTANGLAQMTVPADQRGRVMAIMMAVFNGGTPLGAPFVGWIANRFGPRCALLAAVFGGLGAAVVALAYLIRHRRLRLSLSGLRLIIDDDEGAGNLH